MSTGIGIEIKDVDLTSIDGTAAELRMWLRERDGRANGLVTLYGNRDKQVEITRAMAATLGYVLCSTEAATVPFDQYVDVTL